MLAYQQFQVLLLSGGSQLLMGAKQIIFALLMANSSRNFAPSD